MAATRSQIALESGDAADRYLTAAEIAKVLNLPSEDFVKDLARRRKISCHRMGYRTLRFLKAKVIADLAKLEIKAV